MRHATLHILACAAILLGCGCRQESIPPAVEPEVPDDDKFEISEGPYEYDDDMDYDAEAFLAAYRGEPFNGPHTVPGTLEAEDFDSGAEGVAFHESDNTSAESSYRGVHQVDIRADAGASGGYYIGDVQPGEWMSYTIEVAEDGAYAIDVYVVKGDGSQGNFSFEVDGRGATAAISMPMGGWSDFTKYTTAENVQLSMGRHVLKYCGNTPGNVDRFVFRRTGEMQDLSSSFTYPVSMQMSNPLFTGFRSPMYNSWLTGPMYTADASAHVWKIDGREILYVYASHDMEPAIGCDRMDRYHVFSTEDMKTWTDHGEIMNAATVRKHDGWGSDGFMWAPDCVYNPSDGLYYFYFPHPSENENWNTTWRIGVAVSRYPDREFYVVGHIKDMPAAIDPCVFVDDDGQPYIYNGGGGVCYGGRLRKDDWTRLDGKMSRMTGLEDFHEATWVHKYNGRYYLSHSDNNSPGRGGNRMRYAVSDSPLGPWESLGAYMYPTGIDTNHGSIVEYKGQWYAFYHTGNYSGQGTLRSVCVDPLTINPDGTLETVRNWGTPRGGSFPEFIPSGGPLTLEATDYNEGGYHYAWFTRSGDVPAIASNASGKYVSGLSSGEWIRLSFKSASACTCMVSCRLRATGGSTRVLVSINGEHPESDGVSVQSTGAWTEISVDGLSVPAGECYLELRTVSGKIDAESLTLTMKQ